MSNAGVDDEHRHRLHISAHPDEDGDGDSKYEGRSDAFNEGAGENRMQQIAAFNNGMITDPNAAPKEGSDQSVPDENWGWARKAS